MCLSFNLEICGPLLERHEGYTAISTRVNMCDEGKRMQKLQLSFAVLSTKNFFLHTQFIAGFSFPGPWNNF